MLQGGKHKERLFDGWIYLDISIRVPSKKAAAAPDFEDVAMVSTCASLTSDSSLQAVQLSGASACGEMNRSPQLHRTLRGYVAVRRDNERRNVGRQYESVRTTARVYLGSGDALSLCPMSCLISFAGWRERDLSCYGKTPPQ